MGLRMKLLSFALKKTVKARLARDPEPQALRKSVEQLSALSTPRSAMRFQRAALKGGDPEVAPAIAWGQGRGVAEQTDRIVLYFHGGGYMFGSPTTHRTLLTTLGRETGAKIAALDYRLAPEHPFPAAFDDAMAAWESLRAGAPTARIALAGDSAGGGLALALTAALSARGERPTAVAVFSPWTDLALTGPSLKRFAKRDALLPLEWIQRAADRYLAGADARDPRASPLYATFDAPTPTLIQVGSAEALKDDSLRMADRLRKAGGDVRLELLKDAPHVVQAFDRFAPEGRLALQSAAAFLRDMFEGDAMATEGDRDQASAAL